MAEPLTLADLKALGAASAESGPDQIVFLSGYGETGTNVFVPVETERGNIGYVIAAPPEWASELLLNAFSSRATASVSGTCPACGAVSTFKLEGGSKVQMDGISIVHEETCLASDEMLTALFKFEYDARHPKAGRNEPCPCGSGKKFKKCHGLSN